MIVCPNYSSPEWKQAEALLGSNDAYGLFISNNYELPDGNFIKSVAIKKFAETLFAQNPEFLEVGTTDDYAKYVYDLLEKALFGNIVYQPEKTSDTIPYSIGKVMMLNNEQASFYADGSTVKPVILVEQDVPFVSVDFEDYSEDIKQLSGYENQYLIENTDPKSVTVIYTKDKNYNSDDSSGFVVAKGAVKTYELGTAEDLSAFEKYQQAEVAEEKPQLAVKTKETLNQIVYHNMRLEGMVHTHKKQIYITGSRSDERVYDRDYAINNYKRIINFLNFNGIPLDILRVKDTVAGLIVEFNPTGEYVPDKKYFEGYQGSAQNVIAHLSAVFPDVDVQVVSVKQAKEILANAGDSYNVNSDQVKSFYYQGTAYLIKGRYSKDTAVEEILHPFVDALFKDNLDLFNSLYDNARKEFGDLNQNIMRKYSEDKGFSDLDRAKELVTQALTYSFLKANQKNLPTSWLNKVKQFQNWFLDLIKNLYNLVTGKKLNIESVADIKADLNLNQVAEILNTSDFSIKLTGVTEDSQIKYSIANVEYEEISKNATAEQKATLDKIFNQPVKVKLNEATHVYQSEEGMTYKSVTTAIKGKLHEELNENEISRLVGKDFDSILTDIINGKSFEQIASLSVKDNQAAAKFYDRMTDYINDLRKDGSIILSQVVVADPNIELYKENNQLPIAGSIDILVISPEGTARVIDLKVSKNATTIVSKGAKLDTKTYTQPYPIKHRAAQENEDARLINSNFPSGTRLSTKAQHGIQVNMYTKLLELLGVPTEVPSTINIRLDADFYFDTADGKYAETIESDGEKIYTLNGNTIRRNEYVKARDKYLKESSSNQLNATVRDIAWEREIVHEISDNQLYVDTLIPGARDTNAFKTSQNPEGDLVSPESDMAVEKVIEFINDIAIPALEKRKVILNKLISGSSVFKPKVRTIDEIGSLINILRQEVIVSPVAAFGTFLRKAQADIDSFVEWSSQPKNMRTKAAPGVVINFGKFLETYKKLRNFENYLDNNPDQQKMLRDLLNTINSVGEASYMFALSEVSKGLVENESIRELTEDDLNTIVSMNSEDVMEDISQADLLGGDIDTSTNILLATAARLYKRAMLDIENSVDTAVDEARGYANALIQASGGKADYSFMRNSDGTYVRKLGRAYFDLQRKLADALKGKDGRSLQYIIGTDLTPEQLEFNKDLFAKRTAYREFAQAEKVVDKVLMNGDYHKYTEEFLRERAKYEVYHRGSWVPRSDISEFEMARYRAKYYNTLFVNKPIYDKDGKFTGEVEAADQTRPSYFVKPDYVEAVDREDMLDPRYKQIMSDNSTLGIARRNWYEFWIREHDKGSLGKLPEDVRRQMQGQIPRIQARFIAKLKDKPSSVGTLTLKSLRNFFSFRSQRANSTIIREVFTDETGNDILRRVPVYYVGNLRNEERLQKLIAERDELIKNYKAQEKTKASIDKYRSELKSVNAQITVAESALKPEELNNDLFESFVLFRRMAENFEKMSAIEDSLLALDNMIKQKRFAQTPNLVTDRLKKSNPEEREQYAVQGAESRVAQRFNKWLNMTFYSTTKYQKTDAEYATNKLMALMSFQYVGLNLFGNIHNFLFGKISNSIETIGGRFYDRRAGIRATKESLNFLAGYSKKAFTTKDGYYDIKKPESKYEAFVGKFRMIRDKDSGLSYGYFPSLPYAGQRAGEYMLQSKTGMAYIMSKELVNSKTGETKAIFDAFNYDPNTGELTLQDGFEFTDNDVFNVTNYIWEMNKQIHGNYAWEDRMVIQDTFLGQLVAQFHKWVYPAYKARFQKRYYDANLGDMEGRYRSMWEFLTYLRQTQFTGFKQSWDMLDEMQQQNMMRNLGEASWIAMSFIIFTALTGISEGEDDDDIKRFINVFAYDFNRSGKELLTWVPGVGLPELYQMAKNPVAITRYLGEFADVIGSGLAYPFQEEEERYYSRGINKGRLKLSKEATDVIPLAQQFQRWQSYINTTNFYIQ